MSEKIDKSTVDKTRVQIPDILHRYLSIRATYSPTWSLDDKRLAFITNFERQYNVYTVPSDGGWPHQVTFDGAFKMGVKWAFDDKIMFIKDYDGDENWQCWLISESGTDLKNITDAPKAQNNYGCFSEDRKLFAFSNNDRDRKLFDCFIHDFRTNETRKIIRRDIICTDRPACFTKDNRKLLIHHFFNNMDQDILLFDLETGEEINLTGSDDDEEDVLFTNAVFVDDDRFVYFISDKNREFRNIAKIDLNTGELSWVVEIEHEIESLTFSRDQRFMAYTVNYDGNIKPVIIDRKTGEEVTFDWKEGVYGALIFSHAGDRVAFTYSGPTRPRDIYTADLKTREIKQLTFSFVGGVREEELVEPKSVYYESFDGLRIHAFVYLPEGARKDNSLPCILYPHGGPEAQIFNTFISEFQFFVRNGYVFLVPHFRGSMGFGKSFQKKIYRDWGGGDLQDMLYGVKYLADEGWIDPGRVAVYGASYGGFAALTCLTKAPDAFACGIDAFGPSNLFTFYESNQPNWRPFVDAVLGNPQDHKDLFEDRSPIFHIDNIKAPLLIMQGANDPRVVDEESEQIFDKLKEKGLDVEYLWFPDEGHGFTKKDNRLKSNVVMLEFLNKHLKK